MRLEQAELDAIARGDREAIERLAPTLRFCVRAGANKAGLRREDLLADIEQEILIELTSGMMDRFDQSYNVEPWLIETARRMALNVGRKESRYSMIEDMGDGQEEAEQVMQAHGDLIMEDPTPSLIDRIDRDRVREKAMALLSPEKRAAIYPKN